MEQVLATLWFGRELLLQIAECTRKVRGNDRRGGITVRIDAGEEAERKLGAKSRERGARSWGLAAGGAGPGDAGGRFVGEAAGEVLTGGTGVGSGVTGGGDDDVFLDVSFETGTDGVGFASGG
jgi:hypothetical protein